MENPVLWRRKVIIDKNIGYAVVETWAVAFLNNVMSIMRVLNKFLVTLPQKILRILDCLSDSELSKFLYFQGREP
ncbi:hypothetical protein [Oxobacter pfennigii]|uniref:hypothetical protein n=1 Tax=Oxobacter pfennigii TaxID=36849 RepID=UPI0013649C01|nr:hypothetical protein [Oxobacter pfennigii]